MSPRSPRRRRLIAWRPPDAWRLTPSLILVLVVSFFASGWILSWADERVTDVRLRAGIGEPVWFTPSQTTEVSNVRLGRTLYDLDDMTTPGVFVLAQMRLTSHDAQVDRAIKCHLFVEDREIISSVDSSLALGFPPPGFESVQDLVFEVPAEPRYLVGARLRCTPVDLLDATTNENDIDLGFTDENVQQMIDEAGSVVRVSEENRPRR